MFKRRSITALPMTQSAERFDTLIGPHSLIKGELRLSGSTRIDGQVEGNITAGADSVTVVISEGAQVQGDILAHRVLVAGKVSGQIHATERVELQAQCMVQGDIKYGSIAIEHGARVMGLLLQIDESKRELSGDSDLRQALNKAKAG
ncbi:MAG: polymer-forming cytoskeletal protein [Betaproteobacteria bacterium]